MPLPVDPRSRPLPNIDQLPDSALLTRRNLVELTGFCNGAFKKWARQGRGPRIVYIEGKPRTTVADFRTWIAASSRAA